MIIPIHCVPGASSSEREWAMIELQGEILRRDGDPQGPGYDLGSFKRSSTTGNLLLTIGYHQLEGVEQKLKKPYAILQKDGEGSGSYTIVGFVSSKYLFKQRPRAIISRPAGTV